MENLNNPENFENFKSSIYEIYKMDGWSENLNHLIGIWHKKRLEETDMPGGTIEERVVFQIQLAELYIITERFNYAFSTLNDAWTEAEQEGLTGLVQKIKGLMESMP